MENYKRMNCWQSLNYWTTVIKVRDRMGSSLILTKNQFENIKDKLIQVMIEYRILGKSIEATIPLF